MSELTTVPSLDLMSLARYYLAAKGSAAALAELILDRIAEHGDSAVWTLLLPRTNVLAQVESIESRRKAGESLPLFGVPFAVKDNIDVAGIPTTAGCPAFAYVPERTAPVVECLRKAGALLIGKTNLDQFATGLAGDRTPYGACHNVFNPSFIAGGSSSGSAVAVAAGLVSFALGTDTAGSGRVPAACNNIVGLKPSPGMLSTEGVVPACQSLDCVSVFALTAGDAFLVAELAKQPQPARGLHLAGARHARGETGPGFSFAVPRPEDLEFFGDEERANLFNRAVVRLEEMGGRRREVDLRPFREAGELLYGGPWLSERLAGIEEFLKRRPDDVHPVTRAVIARGAEFSAVELFRAMDRLKSLRAVCDETFDRAEVLVVPTIPALPSLAEVAADSIGASRRLGYYTSFVNLLGLAAIALPSDFDGAGLPTGITLIGPGGSDRRLCELGAEWQQKLALPLGATGWSLPEASGAEVMGKGNSGRNGDGPGQRASLAGRAFVPEMVRLAVAGAHLRGQPLHPELRRAGAQLVRVCRTAPRYRFVALMDLSPPRPGLLRDDERGGAATVEIYDLSVDGFGKLVASVAPPLAIGTIELEDGEAVKGFLCESYAAARARDITDFGGWAAFREHLGNSRSVADRERTKA